MKIEGWAVENMNGKIVTGSHVKMMDAIDETLEKYSEKYWNTLFKRGFRCVRATLSCEIPSKGASNKE